MVLFISGVFLVFAPLPFSPGIPYVEQDNLGQEASCQL
jgi:hypothetical protein